MRTARRSGARESGHHLLAWSDGNIVSVHVHRATYFDRLVDVTEAMGSGDLLLFIDWRPA
jgi:hypothetical protein